MKHYYQQFVLWIANSLRELRLESLGIFVFIPYVSFWYMMHQAQHFMARAAQYASAHHGEQLESFIWSVLFFRVFSLAGATMVVLSQLSLFWYGNGKNEKLWEPLIQSLGLLLIYVPMVVILIASDF